MRLLKGLYQAWRINGTTPARHNILHSIDQKVDYEVLYYGQQIQLLFLNK